MRMPGQPQSDSDDNNDNNDDDNNDDDDASRNEYTVIIDDDIMIHSMMHTSGSRRNRPLVTGEDPTKSISTMAITCRDHLHDWLDRHVDENLRFTIRVTVALALSSLVVLCQPPYPDEVLPSPFWVYITAGVTSFQASPDSGAVMKKAWQRCLGTIIGGVFGLAFGAITILIPLSTTLNNPYVWQALYIGIIQILVSFGIVYYAATHGYRSHYSAILGTVTMGIALFAFYTTTDIHEGWKKGVFRILNIAMGGIVGSLVSVTIFPVSTKHLIEQKVQTLIIDTGTTAKQVLCSVHKQENALPSFHTMIVDPSTTDPARTAVLKCIEGMHKVKGLLPLLDYDLSFKRKSSDEKRRYLESWNMILDRLARIHNNISWIDNILRSNLIGDDIHNDVLEYDLLRRVGTHCEEILDLSNLSEDDRNTVAYTMLNEDIQAIRKEIQRAEADRRQKSLILSLEQQEQIGQHGCRRSSIGVVLDDPSVSVDEMMDMIGQFDDVGTRNFTKQFIEKQTDTFYRMVEILILRCVRQHQLNVVLTNPNRQNIDQQQHPKTKRKNRRPLVSKNASNVAKDPIIE